MLDEKALIPCKINQTVKLSIGDPNVEFNSGCSVIEVSIPPSKRCKVRPTLMKGFLARYSGCGLCAF